MKKLIITDEISGGRLDKLLFRYLDKAPKSFIYKMLRKKNILLNGKKASGNEILCSGDNIVIYFSDAALNEFSTAFFKDDPNETEDRDKQHKTYDLKKFILYEDDNILIFNKPSGLLSQKSAASDISADDMLKEYLGSNDFFTPGISNRLDRNTSGIMMAGKNPNAVRCLNIAVKERALRKYYICIVKGKTEASGELKGFLEKDKNNNSVKISMEQINRGKAVDTRYELLSSNGYMSVLSIELITGKTHQIRAHMASIGHPLAGDVKYGDERFNRKLKQKYGIKSQMLHAYKVEFSAMPDFLDYLNGKVITAAVPKNFLNLMKGEDLCLHGVRED